MLDDAALQDFVVQSERHGVPQARHRVILLGVRDDLSADYMAMNWGGVLLGYGNRPGDILNDPPSLERAEKFFAKD